MLIANYCPTCKKQKEMERTEKMIEYVDGFGKPSKTICYFYKCKECKTKY